MVRLASLCPIHAAITATGTPDRCISVAQVWRAACNLMCRTPAEEPKPKNRRKRQPPRQGSNVPPLELLGLAVGAADQFADRGHG
jgi:hypothetical protein